MILSPIQKISVSMSLDKLEKNNCLFKVVRKKKIIHKINLVLKQC